MQKPLHVLLAEDDKHDRHFFEMALTGLPLPTRLTMTEDGEKLLNFLHDQNNQLPDVIFLDLNMPRKNGQECLMEIKNSLKLKHIPVVIYSTSLYEQVADVLYESGAHFYLQKCDYSELPCAILRTLVSLQNGQKRPPRSEFIVSSPMNEQ